MDIEEVRKGGMKGWERSGRQFLGMGQWRIEGGGIKKRLHEQLGTEGGSRRKGAAEGWDREMGWCREDNQGAMRGVELRVAGVGRECGSSGIRRISGAAEAWLCLCCPLQGPGQALLPRAPLGACTASAAPGLGPGGGRWQRWAVCI